MADATKRMNYFDRQFLRASDFQDEQAYAIDRRRRHNRLLHSPGVAEGLQVTGSAGAGTVSVSAGTAYDGLGQEIVLPSSQQVDVSTISGATATAFITITYGEQASDPSSDPGVTGNNTRTSELPGLAVSATSPASPNVNLLLAKVSLTNGKVASPPDNTVRTIAGTVLPTDLSLHSLTLENDSVPAAQWPKLVCSQANDAALQNGSLVLDNGKEMYFQDNGQVRSFDDNHRLVFNRQNNLLEMHEIGDILLMTGGPPPTEKLRVTAAGNVGIGTSAPSKAKLQVSGMVGNTVGVFGDLGISLVASSPTVGFNSYLNGGWRSISAGFAGSIDVDQATGNMDFNLAPSKLAAADAAFTPKNCFSIHPDGKMASPMWAATQVFNQRQGPLPLSAPFSSGGGTLVIIFSGSGYSAAAGNIGLVVQIDGSSVATTRSFTNEVNSHKAFTTQILVQKGVAAGAHTLAISALVNTTTDANDWFNATVLELPF